MFDVLMNDAQRQVRDAARRFVGAVDPQLLRDMDAEKLEYPRDFVGSSGRAGLLGVRFPKEWGGRGLDWTAESAVIEEFGVLGTALGCATCAWP